jgi:hypothetical protein
MAGRKPIQRDEIIGALTLVIMFIAIMLGRDIGNFYASYNEMKSLKVYFEVSEEELSSYLTNVMNGGSPDIKAGLTITLPSVSNVEGIVTNTPEYVRRWLISLTLSAVIVRQPEVSDVQMNFSIEGQPVASDTLRFPKQKVPYLGFVDRQIELKISDVEGFRRIVESAADAHSGEVKIEVQGKVKAHLWFLDTWLPYSTVRYPLVEVPHLRYLESDWTGYDGHALTTSEAGQDTVITVKFSNPTRVHTIRENITCSVYKGNSSDPVSVFTKEVPMAANSTGTYVFPFTPNDVGIYRYELASGAGVLLDLKNSQRLAVN